MFHVRRRPADAQPRRRKKKTAGQTGSGGRPGNDPLLIEVTPDAAPLENGRRLRITDPIEVSNCTNCNFSLNYHSCLTAGQRFLTFVQSSVSQSAPI